MEYLVPHYKNADVPVYATVQTGRRILAISHYHRSPEVILVREGEVLCCLGAERYRAARGDMLFIPPYAVHGVTALSADAKINGVVWKLSFVAGEGGLSRLETLLNKDRIRSLFFPAREGRQQRLLAPFEEIVRCYGAGGSSYEWDMKAAVCHLVSCLVREYESGAEELQDYRRLAPVIEYIQKNYHEPIPTAALGRLLSVCDDHLIRLFRKTMGVTPAKYINALRLEEAQKLLLGTDLSVTEIAYTVGFSGVPYFSGAFSATFGITPRRYRQENKG